MDNFRYVKPSTVDEAISSKSEYGKKTNFVLGGTDLYIAMDKGVITPEAVIDLNGIKTLKYLEEKDGAIFIGAAVTSTELIESEIIKKSVPALWEAADLVASVGVRNTATLVGNLCNAVPSLEGGAPLYVRDAVDLIKVEYKELPAILDPYDSVKEDAVLIHPDLGNYEIEPWLEAQAGTNIGHLRRIRKGDIDKGFAEADRIVEGEYRIPHVAHTCIETHISVSRFSFDGRLTMWNSTQSPHTQRNIMANALGMAHKDIQNSLMVLKAPLTRQQR